MHALSRYGIHFCVSFHLASRIPESPLSGVTCLKERDQGVTPRAARSTACLSQLQRIAKVPDGHIHLILSHSPTGRVGGRASVEDTQVQETALHRSGRSIILGLVNEISSARAWPSRQDAESRWGCKGIKLCSEKNCSPQNFPWKFRTIFNSI